MTTKYAPGAVLPGRYTVVAAMADPSAWGAVYRVRDEQGNARVARVLRIPRLRSGLDERLDGFRQAFSEWRTHAHPTRVGLVEWRRLDDEICVISTVATGEDVRRLARDRAPAWWSRVASSLAEALLSLLDLPLGAQALTGLSVEHVVVAPAGTVTIVNPGLGRFFRPVMHELDRDTLGGTALRKFGEILYTLVTGDSFDPTDALCGARMPEGVSEVVLRSLVRVRADAFPDLAAALRELRSFEALTWSASLTPDAAPRGDRGAAPALPPAVGALGVKASHLYRTRPLLRALVVAWLIGMVVFLLQSRQATPAFAKVVGPAVFVIEDGGAVEVVEVAHHEGRGLVDLGGRVTDGVYSARLDKALFTVPALHELASVDLATRTVSKTKIAGEAAWSLLLLPGQTMALGIPRESLSCRPYGISQLDVRGTPVRLPEAMRATAYVAFKNALACIPETGSRVVLYAIEGRELASRVLEAPATTLRLDNTGRQLWVLSPRAGGEVQMLDPSTLSTQLSISLPEPPIDIAFGKEIYVLLAHSGGVAVIPRPGDQVARILPGRPGATALLLPTEHELWLMGASDSLEVRRLPEGTAGPRILLRGRAKQLIATSAL